MKNWIIILVIVVATIVALMCILYVTDMKRMENGEKVLFSTWGRDYAPVVKKPDEPSKGSNQSSNIGLVLSLEDSINEDSAWCGTFNLIWNDLKNEIAHKDIEFSEMTDVVRNLNKGTFTTSELSENSYYKIYSDEPSLELKDKIESSIMEKFGETSDILDYFDFENARKGDYFLYCMLKKEFEFEQTFEQLDVGKFGIYDNVKYFGIDKDSEGSIRKQVQALYYDSKDSFAIKLKTKQEDEVIIVKGAGKSSFYDIYMDTLDRKEKYSGLKGLSEGETLKIPEIDFNLTGQIEEVKNKSFTFSDGREYVITEAVQSIKFKLDKKGGKVKSEAGIMAQKSSILQESEEIRSFEVDDTFVIFLKEKQSSLPYFAAKISDITKVQ